MAFALRVAACLVLMGPAALAQAPADSVSARLKQRIRAGSSILDARRAQLDVATARRAATGLRPPVTASAEAEEVPAVANLLSAGSLRIDAAQEFIPAPRRTAERNVADRDVERARMEIDVAAQALDAMVDQLIVKAAGSAAAAARLLSEDSLLRGAEEALRSRFAVGDARYVDVLRLRTERLRVETEIQRDRSEERIARRQLIRLGGAEDSAAMSALITSAVSARALAFLTGAVPALPSLDSLLATSGALRLAANELARAQARRELTLTEGRASPTGSLGLQRFTKEGGGYGFGLTAGISIPLAFTARHATQARLAVAESEIVLARSELTATTARVAGALLAASERYEAARQQIAAYDAALLRGAREEREAALAAYRIGGLTLIELLDFERALAQAEVTRIRSQTEAAGALLDFITAAFTTETAK